MAKKEKAPKVVKKKVADKEVSKEMKAIEEKIAKLQTTFSEVAKTKQDLIKKLKAIDEQIVKMQGSYQTLMELKADIQKSEAPKAEVAVEEKCECGGKDCKCDQAVDEAPAEDQAKE